MEPAAAVRAICATRMTFLQGLVIFQTFGRGWTARVAACEALGVKMAEHARIGAATGAAPTGGTTLKLDTLGRVAAQSAGRRRRSAAATATVGAAAAAGAALRSDLPSWPLVLVLAVGALATAGALVWRARQQQARADAYRALAHPAAPPAAKP